MASSGTSACDLLGTGHSRRENRHLEHACNHEHMLAATGPQSHDQAMQGMHQGMGMLGALLTIVDQGVQEEIGAEETDPTYLGASNHVEHTSHLHSADQGLKGAQFAAGFMDSLPIMIDRFQGGGV
mmetsp:Transcript_20264/g.52311  ORF Transcript_20264/g.52311 Transcript_20264/m.52311 type:complete len:126 (+) Transcript_20264:65-442(+)